MPSYVGEHARERAHYRDDGHWPAPVQGDEDVSSGELAAFLLEHPEITTRSVAVQRALCFIHRFRPSKEIGP